MSSNLPDLAFRYSQVRVNAWWWRASYFLTFSGMAMFWSFASLWMEEKLKILGYSDPLSWIGCIVSLSLLANGVGGLFWGAVIDRRGKPRQAVAAGISLLFISSVCLCFWVSLTGFFVQGFLGGFGMSAILNGLSYLTLQSQGKKSGGKSYAKTRIFGSGGYILALLVTSIAFLYTDISYFFCFIIGMILLGCDFVVVLLAPVSKIELKAKTGTWKELIFEKPLLLFCFSWLLASFATPLNMTLMANYVKSISGSKALISSLFAFQGIVAIVTLPIIGGLADKFNLKFLILAALAGPGLRAFSQSLIPSAKWMFAVQFLHILTFVIPEICCLLYARSLVKPEHHATAVGLYSSFRVAGIFISSSICGVLIDQNGYIFTQRLMGCFAFLGVILFAMNMFFVSKKNKTVECG